MRGIVLVLLCVFFTVFAAVFVAVLAQSKTEIEENK